ncbi:hypothetical protein DAPPUDRAFT_262824 [Daphnia pulex]|uniref:RRM domain-containing protein n=1 Tax=Daphnia pulex TaxID=6669 RepID=E9HNR6_DAPPU|nr:hypothetical protein DAPPUDRAFT_262824 [Daphnia pulex]|eukprot:EFX66600.1 hypothetical protein DAPPUDRAFT_262824 [Daphnia pulex]
MTPVMTPIQEDHQVSTVVKAKQPMRQSYELDGLEIKGGLRLETYVNVPKMRLYFKVACVRNLPHDFKEEKLQEVFEVHGPIQRVKILEDYAYARIENRDDAVHALDALDGYDLYGAIFQISLAKANCVAKSPYQQRIVKFDRKAQVYRSTGPKAVSLDEVVGVAVPQTVGVAVPQAVGVADPPAGGLDAFAVVGVADPQAVGLDAVVVVGDAKAPVLGLDTAPLNDAAAPGNCLAAALEPSKESSNKDETYKGSILQQKVQFVFQAKRVPELADPHRLSSISMIPRPSISELPDDSASEGMHVSLSLEEAEVLGKLNKKVEQKKKDLAGSHSPMMGPSNDE